MVLYALSFEKQPRMFVVTYAELMSLFYRTFNIQPREVPDRPEAILNIMLECQVGIMDIAALRVMMSYHIQNDGGNPQDYMSSYIQAKINEKVGDGEPEVVVPI